MKKCIALLLCLLLTACGNPLVPGHTERVQQALGQPCSFTADFTCGTLQGTAEVTCQNGTLTAVLQKPETVAGLQFVLGEDSAAMSYGGITFELGENSLRQESAIMLLHRILSGQDALTVTEADGVLQASADCVLFGYIVTLTGEDLIPTQVSVPELETEIKISDYIPLSKL